MVMHSLFRSISLSSLREVFMTSALELVVPFTSSLSSNKNKVVEVQCIYDVVPSSYFILV